LAFLADKSLPPKVGSIHIATVAWLPALHKLSVHIGLYQSLATAFLLILSAASVWLAKNRRRMVISLSVLFSVMMLLSLLSIRITKALVVARAGADYQTAVSDTLNIVFHPLIVQTYTLLSLSVLTGLVAWLGGPYRSAKLSRSRVQELLAGRLHQSVFGKRENAVTLWTGHYKRWLQWGSVLAVAVIMLLVQLTPLAVLAYGLLMLLLVLGVEFLAAKS